MIKSILRISWKFLLGLLKVIRDVFWNDAHIDNSTPR